MMKVEDFALLPQRTKEVPDFLQIIKNKHDLGPGYDDIYDLNRS